MPLSDGDVIDFDYELWVEGKEGLHDTTLREAAEQEGILEPNAFYAPMSYVIGSGRIIPGLEKELRELPVGKTATVELAAADAYGERDPKLVETLPIAEFKKSEVEPHIGMQLTHKNRRGVVTTVGGGRVRVDFNPPLAGKKLTYKVTIRRVAKSDVEKLGGLLKMHFPAPFDWKVEADTKDGRNGARVAVPEQALYHQNWLTAKMRVLVDARRFTKLDEVRYVEAYRLREPEGAAEEAPTSARA